MFRQNPDFPSTLNRAEIIMQSLNNVERKINHSVSQPNKKKMVLIQALIIKKNAP